MEKEYLLSLCIPTYNRADLLEKTLESLVEQLDDEIEIVISDNCSTDNTEEVGRRYAEEYDNINYYRNEVNVRDANFSLSLDRGTGLYLKLMKDNLEMTGESLQYIKENIRHYMDNKLPLFFTNGSFLNGKCKDTYMCKSFDDFIIHTYFRVTSITFFGCWREHWGYVKERDKYSELQLSQDDWVYQLLALYNKAVLFTKKIYFMYDVGKRAGYNWFKVHVANYYKIMEPYVNEGLITESALKKEKSVYISSLKPQLTHAFLYKYITSWDFDFTGKYGILWSHFKAVPKFYLVMVTLPFTGVWIILKNKVREFLVAKGVWKRIRENGFVRRFA